MRSKDPLISYMVHSLQNGVWNERPTGEFCLVCWETGILIIYFRIVYEKARVKEGRRTSDHHSSVAKMYYFYKHHYLRQGLT